MVMIAAQLGPRLSSESKAGSANKALQQPQLAALNSLLHFDNNGRFPNAE